MTSLKKHFVLIDVLKILTLLAIAVLHTNEFVFYKDIFPLGIESPTWFFVCYVARFFALGGQILVATIYFFFGFTQKSKKKLLWISLFAFLGQCVLALIFGVFEWDIYAFLAVTSFIIAITPFLYTPHPVLIPISFLALWVPINWIQSFTPENPFWVILTGKMTTYNTGSWPLLPWFYLSLLFYQTGLVVKKHFVNFTEFHKFEAGLWPLLLLMCFPFLGFYYWSPIGPNFYHFAFNQQPYIFWANFLVFVFWMRVGLLSSVQKKLSEIRAINWVSDLYWVRHLGLTYLLSLIYLAFGMSISDQFEAKPLLFDLFFIALMPVSEGLSRLIIAGIKKIKAR